MESALSLPQTALTPLPLGAIKPAGWLKNQLRIQAEGLSGHLDEFWPDVARSKWIGGDAEGWERGPYWLDGIVPLAVLLEDERLLRKARHWIDYILDHQHPDGWLGALDEPGTQPGTSVPRRRDPWPLFIVFKAMTQWQEATSDERIIPTMLRAMRCIQELIATEPLSSWAKMRWMDLVLSVLWLHERTREVWLMDLARTAEQQGYNWNAHFADFQFTEKQPQWTLENHVVNHAMGLKEPAIRYRLHGDREGFRKAAEHNLAVLDRWHGQATGLFSGDESLAGLSPSQGTELCAVVEEMFSLEVLSCTFSPMDFADRLERIAYNALPATLTKDMWAHQYVQQTNQVMCKVSEERVYTNNGPDSNVFGLEPNFGCCTANMHQGWPKFVEHLWLRTNKGGLMAIAYAPCTVTTTVADGKQVTLDVATDYPFRETVTITIHTQQPTRFRLYLRIPEWCTEGTIQTNTNPKARPGAGVMHVQERDWKDGDTVILTIPASIQLIDRPNGAKAITRGPLVYALRIGEEFKYLKGELPQADWEVYPTTPWNYALAMPEENPESSITVREIEVGPVPFATDVAPVSLFVPACRVPDWGMEKNAATPPPQSPVETDTPVETVELIPYGSTHLRVTEFPWANL